jgi:sporulation protein YlmC with PRC-barrel domain
MRLDTLRHRAVVDPETGSRVGTVTDYWVDAAAGRVAALIIRPVDADLPQRVSAERVARVGRHAVMLSRPNVNTTNAATPAPVRPDWLDRRHMRGLTVYTDAGERLGQVDGAEIDPRTLSIENYDLVPPLWQRWLLRRQHIAAASVAWCGRDVLVVRSDELPKLRPVGHEDGTYDPPATPAAKPTQKDRAASA